ncbi:MAG: threonylcarbamoyl-AMP synthase [Cryobacterium sp.]|nr:threonylcarbamoyl-AMP synthase [Oligoflexia bacterium]
MKSSPPLNARILDPTDENIQNAVLLLKQGGIVAMPTETVYGLAGNAFDAQALSKIFLAKDRPTFDPLIAHVALEKSTFADLMREQLVSPQELSDLAVKRIDRLIREYWPGPLTLVLPRGKLVPDLATSGMETVAIRAPKHPVARRLIRELGLPVCAPSANRFGRISPTSAKDVKEELGDRIELILDGGDCEIGIESTILQITEDGEPILLRPGVISREALAKTLGVSIENPCDEPANSGSPRVIAPGRLESHYAPKKPLRLLATTLAQMMTPPILPGITGRAGEIPAGKKVGLLISSGNAKAAGETLSAILDAEVITETLSEKGDWLEAAQNFFKKLRALDASDANFLLAEPIPQAVQESSGIAYAIADRLLRAAAPKE